jgi:hypothetical protein
VRRLLVVLLLLASCGGGSKDTGPTTPVDEALQRESRAGRLAYDLEHPEEAVTKYQAALTRAQARDDLEAIGNLGYNLAIAQLNVNAPDRALSVARTTRTELQRRGVEPFPGLLLVEATALYRTGDLAEADAMAARAAAGNDAEAAARAVFLRGLIADDRGDEAGLAAAASKLSGATAPALQADAAELMARLALRRDDPAGARQQAERAEALRRDTLDYRGLARALALGGEAAKRGGDPALAADLFLRAGRSAAAQRDAATARPWLKEAVALATDPAVGKEAKDLLKQLQQNQR